MTEIIDATIIRGCGVASKNIKFQMPHLIWHFPEIKDIFTASINVNLDKALTISKVDFTTLPIAWWDVDEKQGHWAVERFSFVRIKFEYPIGGTCHTAWFFDCHNSAYHGDTFRFEIITEKIANLSNGQRCRIHIP